MDINDQGRSSSQHNFDHFFYEIMDALPLSLVLVDSQGRITLCTKLVEEIFQYSRDELLGNPIEKLIPARFHQKHLQYRADYEKNRLKRQMAQRRDVYALRKDGTEVPVEISLSPITFPQGNFTLVSIIDITIRKCYESEMNASNKELDKFSFSASSDYEKSLQTIEHLSKTLIGELKDALDHQHTKMLNVLHEKISHLGTAFKKEQQALVAKAIYYANHDQLTQLPNRRYFIEVLKHDIFQHERRKTNIALLFLDVDEFKRINDNLGHEAGDMLLKIIAKRLKTSVRKSDMVARFGGDEFVILVTNLNNPNDLPVLCKKILANIAQPIMLNNLPCKMTISIGIALYPSDASEAEQLLTHADDAMYASKAKGKNCFTYYHERQ